MGKKNLKTIADNLLEEIAERFQAIGEVSRLRILRSLQSGEKSVSDLVAETGLNQPNVSRHLSVLSNAGLIRGRKEGVSVFYRVIDENLFTICELVCQNVK